MSSTDSWVHGEDSLLCQKVSQGAEWPQLLLDFPATWTQEDGLSAPSTPRIHCLPTAVTHIHAVRFFSALSVPVCANRPQDTPKLKKGDTALDAQRVIGDKA